MIKISLEEQKQIRLKMLREIDSFCRKHEIKYSLAFGTLLGAIRHKGFIPWDDDMDIFMPLPDMLKFRELFKSETLKYYDIDVDSSFDCPFSRIVHQYTVCKKGLFYTNLGVFIDLYPLVGFPSLYEEAQQYLNRGKTLEKRYAKPFRLRRRLLKLIPIGNVINFEDKLRDYRDFLYYSVPYDQAKSYIHGSLKMNNVLHFNPFEKLIEVEFEGSLFYVPENYHETLTTIFGDYMQLPPIKERKPNHSWPCFWK